MPAPHNPFKQSLKDGETVFGCWLGLADTFSTELMGTAGFDWLVIDGEHAPNDLRSILAQLQVLEASPSHPVVRVPIGETYMLKQVLDAGAQTVVVPMVDNADQARQLVRDVTYPPHGDRGVGYALTRAVCSSGPPIWPQTWGTWAMRCIPTSRPQSCLPCPRSTPQARPLASCPPRTR